MSDGLPAFRNICLVMYTLYVYSKIAKEKYLLSDWDSDIAINKYQSATHSLYNKNPMGVGVVVSSDIVK